MSTTTHSAFREPFANVGVTCSECRDHRVSLCGVVLFSLSSFKVQGHDLSQLLVFYLKCTVGLPLLSFCCLFIFLILLIHQLLPHTRASHCYYLFCGIGLQLTMVPVRPDVAYGGLITSLASVKNGALLCVSTEICHLCLPLRNTSRELNECELI